MRAGRLKSRNLWVRATISLNFAASYFVLKFAVIHEGKITYQAYCSVESYFFQCLNVWWHFFRWSWSIQLIMYLYNLTLQRATGITHAVQGNFSGSKQQEIVIARGKVLEIVRPDPNTGKVHTLLASEVFGIIRSLISFRLTGGTKGNF